VYIKRKIKCLFDIVTDYCYILIKTQEELLNEFC